jgi:hypothetical protein
MNKREQVGLHEAKKAASVLVRSGALISVGHLQDQVFVLSVASEPLAKAFNL